MALLVMRLRAEYIQGEWDRVVHLAATPDDGVPGTLVSLCNQLFESYEVDLLPAVTGFPCDVCLHNAPTDQAGETEQTDTSLAEGWKPSPYPRDPHPIEAVAGQAAIGFNNPALIHRVPEKPLAKVFEGRTVVIAECGLLAYPLSDRPGPGTTSCESCGA